MDSSSAILNNIMLFVNQAIIVSGHGYDYQSAIWKLYYGENLESVLDWYKNIIES